MRNIVFEIIARNIICSESISHEERKQNYKLVKLKNRR